MKIPSIFLTGALIGGLPLGLVRSGEPIPRYAAVDLGTLGGSYSVATGINDLGQVVGYSSNGTAERAFLWLPRPAYGLPRGMNDLGALSGGWSAAYDINNLGQVVGESRIGVNDENGDPIAHAFLWNPSTHALTDLGVLPNAEGGSVAWAINDSGQIVGASVQIIEYGYFHAFLWLPTAAFGLPAGLNRVPGFDGSVEANVAYEINELGEVVGFSGSDFIDEYRAFVWLPQPAYGMGSGLHVPTGIEQVISSGAVGINIHGQIIGSAISPDVDAFLWDNGQLTSIAESNQPNSNAIAINNTGLILGSYRESFLVPRQYFLWLAGGQVPLSSLILNNPQWYQVVPMALNNKGQIVGWNDQNSILLSPIEPDLDGDMGVHLNDYVIMLSCLTGPAQLIDEDCSIADIDANGVVDLQDFQVMTLAQ